MGFRSVFVTQDYAMEWPKWFVDKYSEMIHFPESFGLLSSKFEFKIYDNEIFIDMQKALIECGEVSEFRVIVLHECGGITAVDISQTEIVYSEPLHFRKVDFIKHWYCSGCSPPIELLDSEPLPEK